MKTSGIIYLSSWFEAEYDFDEDGNLISSKMMMSKTVLSNSLGDTFKTENLQKQEKHNFPNDKSTLEEEVENSTELSESDSFLEMEFNPISMQSRIRKVSPATTPKKDRHFYDDRKMMSKDRANEPLTEFRNGLNRRDFEKSMRMSNDKFDTRNSSKNNQRSKKSSTQKHSMEKVDPKTHKSRHDLKKKKKEAIEEKPSGLRWLFGALSTLLKQDLVVRFVLAIIAGVLVFGTIFSQYLN